MSELTAIDNSIISIGNDLVQVVPSVDPYNPLGLPPYTVRVKVAQGHAPEPTQYMTWDSKVLVDPVENVWDITKNSTSWGNLFGNNHNITEVLGANASGVTNMASMFYDCTSLISVALFDTSSATSTRGMFTWCHSLPSVPLFDTSSCVDMQHMFSCCNTLTTVPLFNTSSCTNMSKMFILCSSLTSVPLFDTSSCTDMSGMFQSCGSLTIVPLFDTSSCIDMDVMFERCVNVQSGALALYQQASTQQTPPKSHDQTFTDCGDNTVTGAAELAQIPRNWGGEKG